LIVSPGDSLSVRSQWGYLMVSKDTVNSVQEDAVQATLLHGEKTGPLYMISNGSRSNGAGSAQGLYVAGNRRYLFSGVGNNFGSSGMPSGQVGLFTTVANTKFTPFSVYEDSSSRDMAGRWINWQPNLDGLNAVNPSTSRYKFSSNGFGNYRPSMINNLRLGKFQAVFSVKRESSSTTNNVDFCFNGGDQDSFDSLKISHSNTQTAPFGSTEADSVNSAVSSETRTSTNTPTLGASDVLWVQVTDTGSAHAAGLWPQSSHRLSFSAGESDRQPVRLEVPLRLRLLRTLRSGPG
jgi:hypothetical protein